MNPIERGLRRVDAAQQRVPVLSLAFAVQKKFGDDTASNLAALVTYYGFLSLFPLLLVLVTVLSLVAGDHPALIRSIERSALSEFPVFGTKIGSSIHAMHRDSVFGLVVGLVGLAWGAQGAVQTGQMAMADVWNVPRTERPGFLPRLGRSLLMLAVAFVFLVASTAASGFGSFAPSFARSVPVAAEAGGVAVSFGLNVVLFLLAFRILTPKDVPWRQMVPGAVAAGMIWSVLQYGGALIIDHELRGSSEVYGFFGIVLGLLAWIFLGARVTMYAAELNVVRARHLWPRSLLQPPLTPADREVYAALTVQTRHRPEQRVDVSFDPAAGDGGQTGGG